MKNYLELLNKVITTGDLRMDRTSVGTTAIFGEMLKFDLQKGFPIITTKKVNIKLAAGELACFLEGCTSAERMRHYGVKFWDANANAEYWQKMPTCKGPDDMGKVYGAIWRDFNGIDQLQEVIYKLRENPTDRRILVTAWDPTLLPQQCLPPCHIFMQFFVRGNYLDCVFYMRSVDTFLGLPYDIALYALLTHIISNQTGYKPGMLTAMLADTHIYNNHRDQVLEQITRKPYILPQLKIEKEASIDNFTPDMIELDGYTHHSAIKAKMAI